MKCSGCLHENPPHAKFCLECGTPFRQVDQTDGRSYADLQRSLSEALEQQTAMADILTIISASPTSLQPVLDEIVKSAARFCGAPDASIFELDGANLRAQAHHGPVSQPIGFLVPLVRGSVGGRCVLERQPVGVSDLQRETHEYPEGSALARQTGQRATLAVPLLRNGAPIGVMLLRRAEAIPFTDKQIALLQTFADQAVIAIENARLFQELEARNRDLTATSEILQVISQSPTDVQPVFDAIVRAAVRLCGGYFGVVTRYDGHVVTFVAEHNIPAEGLRQVAAIYPGPPQPDTITGRVLLSRAVVHEHDVSHSRLSSAASIGEAAGYRTIIGVPMLRDGEPIGTINIARREMQPFSPPEIALLRTFADQAVIAIENVRLFTELQEKNRALTEALEQQTATGEILRTIAHVQTDAQPVFDTIVQSAARLCNSAVTGLFLTDGQMVYLPANYGSSPETLAVNRARFPRPLDMDTPPGVAMLTRSVVHVSDTEDGSTTEYARQAGRLLGFRSAVTVPMLREGEAVGAIAVTRRDPGRFSDAEVALLKTFADQAVIAVENVRLFKELEARTGDLTRSVEQLTALGEVGRAVSSTLDLETVLSTIVSRAVQLSSLDGGVVFEYDDGTEEFVQRVATETGGALAEARRSTRIRKGEGVLGQTAITREPVQVPDISVPGAYEGRLRENLLKSGIRAILAVPMLREGQLIGCLGVTRNDPGEFPAEIISLLRTFATQSALAIQNARLFREIEQKSRELESASRHKSEFLANMSHELRTPLNAIIGFSEVLGERMFGELNEKQEEYLNDIHASGQHLLSLINDILDLSKIEAGKMDLELSDFDLPMAIDNALTLVRERAGRRSIALHMTVHERIREIRADERKIRQVMLNLLSNAIKFTPEGGRIEVRATPVDRSVEVSVTDTGVGIAPDDQEAVFEEFRQVGAAAKKVEGTGLGLALSRKFIELHGGRIWVKSQVGSGSTFAFTIPVRHGE